VFQDPGVQGPVTAGALFQTHVFQGDERLRAIVSGVAAGRGALTRGRITAEAEESSSFNSSIIPSFISASAASFEASTSSSASNRAVL
jgi:hypothetical protein